MGKALHPSSFDTDKVSKCNKLKQRIKKQFCHDVIDWKEFDVGYISGVKRSSS